MTLPLVGPLLDNKKNLILILILIVFGVTRTGFDSKIYRTQGEHANHYTSDAATVTCD